MERKIIFYRWASAGTRRVFIPHEGATALGQLLQSDPDRAVLDNRGITSTVVVISTGDETSPTYFQLLALRTVENRPFTWGPDGRLSELPIGNNRYPADATHVILWPDGTAAHDMGSNSPRLGRLSYYLSRLVQERVSFTPLYNPETYERLEGMQGQFRSCDFALTRSEYPDQDRGAFASLIPSVFGRQVPSVGVRIGMGRFGPKDRYLDEDTEESIMELARAEEGILDNMTIRGRDRRTDKIESVNLFNERLQVMTHVPAHPSIPSLPSQDDIYGRIEYAYRRLTADGTLSRATEIQRRRDG